MQQERKEISGKANTIAGFSIPLYLGILALVVVCMYMDCLPAGLVGGNDYEKLETARLLNSSEYKVNTALGYISLKSTLQPDQVLAVAYEYTYKGQTFQVGEFSSDIKDNQQVLYVKALKNTACTPQMGNWDLMMKNVYSLGATSLQSDKFRLNIKYLSDTTGAYLSYLPEPSLFPCGRTVWRELEARYRG